MAAGWVITSPASSSDSSMCSGTHANYHMNRFRHASNVGETSQAEEEGREEGNKETEGGEEGGLSGTAQEN